MPLDKPTPEQATEKCPYSGAPSFTGSSLKECLIQDRVSCAHHKTPDLYHNCFVARNHINYLESIRALSKENQQEG